jgi:hypothetical protein
LTAVKRNPIPRDKNAMNAIPEDFSNSTGGFGGFSPLTTTNKGGNDAMLTPHSTSSMGYMNKTSNLPARIASREEQNRPLMKPTQIKGSSSRPKSANKKASSKTTKNVVPLLQIQRNNMPSVSR